MMPIVQVIGWLITCLFQQRQGGRIAATASLVLEGGKWGQHMTDEGLVPSVCRKSV
ncbi:hypothetical protein HF925_11295 [Acidithiobacillus ferriphilus]|uniref:hypothetical protein n=2 Tax=Acidithiobacillus ferriphilus TaxID=1689834 RepID=UPI001C066118|nr:hypothetical protein [Acidithiobacillus ferriphilus]MBU2849146.1 hypothetical protein [Acidithiobacillus ferriphilus]